MNIKRMADQYRDNVECTGMSLKNLIDRYLLPDSRNKIIVGEYRTNIKRWYNHLHKALGSEKDLKELQEVWEYLVKLSELCDKKNTEILYKERRLIVEKIQKHMERFLKKLPRLIEKSLTRAVRESGIRLR